MLQLGFVNINRNARTSPAVVHAYLTAVGHWSNDAETMTINVPG